MHYKFLNFLVLFFLVAYINTAVSLEPEVIVDDDFVYNNIYLHGSNIIHNFMKIFLKTTFKGKISEDRYVERITNSETVPLVNEEVHVSNDEPTKDPCQNEHKWVLYNRTTVRLYD